MPRPLGASPPCYDCPKGKANKFEPYPQADLSAKNRQALAFYYQVKGGAPMPEDEVVRQNCALIRMVEDAHERAQLGYLNLTPLLTAAMKRGRN